MLGGLARAGSTSPRNLLIVLARGAWDITYALDPKDPERDDIQGPAWRAYSQTTPDTTDETISTYGGISIAENRSERPSVSSFFQTWGSHALVVNGIAMKSIAHDACRLRILTGGTRDYLPDLGAIAGYEHRAGAALGYVDFSGLGYVGGFASSVGMIGNANQVKMLLDARAGPIVAPDGTSYPLFSFGQSSSDAIQEYLDAAAARSTWGLTTADAERFAALGEARAAAAQLRADGVELAAAMELGAELDIGDEANLAVQMLTAGLCRAVLIEADLGWDTHDNNSAQGGKFESLFSGLDGLAGILCGADSPGSCSGGSLWDETVVVVLSEFTRTPKLNAEDGKDHWPVASALLFGGPVSGDRVLGGTTDDTFEPQPVDLSTGAVDAGGVEPDFGNLIAGILAGSDVDPAEYLPGVEPYDAITG